MHILLCNLSRRNAVGKLSLWLIHTIHNGLEEERKVTVDWHNLIGKHLLGIRSRLGQDTNPCILCKSSYVDTLRRRHKGESRASYLEVHHTKAALVSTAGLPKYKEDAVGFSVVGISDVDARPLQIHIVRTCYVVRLSVVHKPTALVSVVKLLLNVVNPSVFELRRHIVPLEY